MNFLKTSWYALVIVFVALLEIIITLVATIFTGSIIVLFIAVTVFTILNRKATDTLVKGIDKGLTTS